MVHDPHVYIIYVTYFLSSLIFSGCHSWATWQSSQTHQNSQNSEWLHGFGCLVNMVATGIVASSHQILPNMRLPILSGAPTLYEQLPALNIFTNVLIINPYDNNNQIPRVSNPKQSNLEQWSPSVRYFLVQAFAA